MPEIVVTVTETVTYQHAYQVEHLATILDVEPTEEAVRAELDASNDDYGTARDSDGECNEALLDSIMDHFFCAEERQWEFS